MLSPLNHLKKRANALFLVLISIFIFSPIFAQVQIWGTSSDGGPDQIGTIFNLFDDGTSYQIKNEFLNNPEGNAPRSNLVAASDGYYYGITSAGGFQNAGTLFRYSAVAGIEILHHLNPGTEGSGARGDIIEISNGIFVGTTFSGGENGVGTLFKYSVSGGLSVLHQFTSSSGGNPTGAIAYAPLSEEIFGTCSSGGDFNAGVCFSYAVSNGYEVIHHFEGDAGGSYPQGGVIRATDGMLYGTTQYGGAHSQGSIFRLNPASDDFTVLYDLNSTTGDGRYPFGNLLESSPGVFLGTCSEGGANGSGTLFKILADGTFTRLKSLQPTQNGAFPKAGLGKSDGGQFYGVTEFGGLYGYGTLFTISEDGTFAKLHDFNYTQDGSSPVGGLISDGNGNMIGAATGGGANNHGTLYKVTSNLEVIKLHDFSMPLGGASPHSITKNENQFYGTTSTGGAYNTGVFYKIQVDGTTEVLHNFNPNTDGQNPNGELFLSEDGKYYGTARFGGEGQAGTVFSITTEGTLQLIHSFDNPDLGQFPYGGVVKTADGTLYGTTLAGGTYSDGTLYAIAPDGTFSVVHNFFSYFDGGSPQAGLTIGANGKIYGLTASGGTLNAGSLFELDPTTNTLTVIHNFDNATDGGAATGSLTLHSDGNLYGTTTEGAAGGGTLFRYTQEGLFEILHTFDPSTDGSHPNGGLVEDQEGNLIGFCNQGGTYGVGTCFSYHPTSGFSLIYSFSPSDSPHPKGSPALFFPECFGDAACPSSNPCAVPKCYFGLCQEVPINPVFTALEIGQCEVGLDLYTLTLGLSMDINPGDSLTIAGQKFAIFEGINTYEFTITNLPANAEAIDLVYSFDATGCSGTTGNIGTAPVPCPPIEVTFILDASDLEISAEGLHIGGTFNVWDPSQNPMTLNSDGFYETMITIGSGDYEFNFFNGASLFDGEYVIGECASNGKRQLTVGSESQTVQYCWASCLSSCSVGIDEKDLKYDFSVVPNLVSQGQQAYLNLKSDVFDFEYAIVGITGKTVETGKTEGQRTLISTGNLTPGMYTIVLRENRFGIIRGVKRFVIQ